MKKLVIILYSILLVLDVAAFVFGFFSESINAAVGLGLMLIFAIPLLPISFYATGRGTVHGMLALLTIRTLFGVSITCSPIMRSAIQFPIFLFRFSWPGMSNCWLIANVFSRRESQK